MLSAIIAKAGVLAIVRLVFYVTGASFLRGTWVQIACLSLALLTVFMGSMMAFREDLLKKRLAYSSVSQISYVLVGLFTLTENGVAGGLLHVAAHASIKICLFLAAGSLIVNLQKTRVSELDGVGKAMPITLFSFTIASLGLIGIPPASGFVSKWYLAGGALNMTGTPGWFSILGPAVLLISALLTAGYLLTIAFRGFFPGRTEKGELKTFEKQEPGWMMLAPMMLLTALMVLLGIFPGALIQLFQGLGEALL